MKSISTYVNENTAIDESWTFSKDRSIGINKNDYDKALKILTDRKLKFSSQHSVDIKRNNKDYTVIHMSSGSSVGLALVILQKNHIDVYDTEKND